MRQLLLPEFLIPFWFLLVGWNISGAQAGELPPLRSAIDDVPPHLNAEIPPAVPSEGAALPEHDQAKEEETHHETPSHSGYPHHVQNGSTNETGMAQGNAPIDVQPASESSPEPSIDPTDPTAIRFQINTSFEWENLKGNQGNTYGLFVVEPWIPLSAQDLLTIEIRLASSALNGQPTFVGMGDTRIRYFHLMPVQEGGILKAVAPSLDMFLPTGDESKGLGGGSWIIAPNVVMALQLSDAITAYPFLRFVQSIRAVDPATASDGGFPGDEDDVRQDSTISGFNFEMPITLQLADTWWFTINPNVFKNFAGNRSSSFSSKFSVTTMISDSVSPTLEVTVPIAGSNTFDFALKGSVTFFF